MLLTEAEGKKLLTRARLYVPHSVMVNKHVGNFTALTYVMYPAYIKAQVLHGNRALQGLVKKAESPTEAEKIVKEYFDKADQVLAEEAVTFDEEMYLSIKYDTRTRTPVVLFSRAGGAGMDERGDQLVSQPLLLAEPLTNFEPYPELTDTVNKVFDVFKKNDATLVEINPLVKKGRAIFCLDAKIELEDVAQFRHKEWAEYGERGSVGRPWTEREERAHANSHLDHRGVAGESFFEFPGGEIGVMASGGGASTLAMDALMAEGLTPANYTEYSGNPTREKVKGLTDIVLSMPDLKGLYVVGSNANFTDILDTLSGVIDGLLESAYVNQPGFTLLVRRGGPRWQEAFQMVNERLAGKPLKIKLFGPEFPLVKTAKEMKDLIAR